MEKLMVSKYWPSFVLVLIGAVVFMAGYWLVSKNKVEIEVYEATDNQEIIIDIAGGVVSPGMYTLKPGSRLKDALVSAGGLSDKADRESFEQSFNLAEIIKDGEKIYIPMVGGVGEVQGESTGKISINKANKEALMSLSGIGESRATKIIEGRPYKSLEELVERKIVGEALFADIKSQIVLW